jgi:hypothetical protein
MLIDAEGQKIGSENRVQQERVRAEKRKKRSDHKCIQEGN